MPLVDPSRPGINHLCLCVADLEASRKFYDRVMPGMGFRIAEHSDEPTYVAGNYMIYLQQSRDADASFHRYGIGLQHLAFNAPSREDVDQLHVLLQKIGAKITEAPAAYPKYSEQYYAVFFSDPSGIQLEYCYTPDLAL